jgi:lysophospholipase L1-like esterase
MSRRKIFLVALFSCLILIFFWEIIGPHIRPLPHILDGELGWTLRPNYQNTFNQRDQSGNAYTVNFETNELGLRTYGKMDSCKLKILVLGDSYTGAPYSGNEQMWYSEMVRKIDSKSGGPKNSTCVVAGGAGGYGTLQELILLKRILSSYRPNAIVVQFSGNDFQDNHMEWQGKQIVRAQKFRRPYQDSEGKISYSPELIAPIWRIPHLGDGRFFSIIDGLITNAQYYYYGKDYGPKLNQSIVKQYQAESLEITSMLFNEMRHQIPSIPIYIVNASFSETGFSGSWIKLAKAAGLEPLIVPSRVIEAQRQKDSSVMNQDGGHWSNLGNQIFGDAVAESLLAEALFVKVMQKTTEQ